MMERYFDAFMYWANFGTRKLMFRLPPGTLDTEAVKPFGSTDAFSVIETGSHVIISFVADRDPDCWEDEEPEGELADMAQVITSSQHPRASRPTVSADQARGDARLLTVRLAFPRKRFVQAFQAASACYALAG